MLQASFFVPSVSSSLPPLSFSSLPSNSPHFAFPGGAARCLGRPREGGRGGGEGEDRGRRRRGVRGEKGEMKWRRGEGESEERGRRKGKERGEGKLRKRKGEGEEGGVAKIMREEG